MCIRDRFESERLKLRHKHRFLAEDLRHGHGRNDDNQPCGVDSLFLAFAVLLMSTEPGATSISG